MVGLASGQCWSLALAGADKTSIRVATRPGGGKEPRGKLGRLPPVCSSGRKIKGRVGRECLSRHTSLARPIIAIRYCRCPRTFGACRSFAKGADPAGVELPCVWFPNQCFRRDSGLRICVIVTLKKGGSLSRSDEGGFGRARHFCRAQPDSRGAAKPTEVGGAESGGNGDQTIATQGTNTNDAPPRCGEGCGDTLIRESFLQGSSIVRQSAPPS